MACQCYFISQLFPHILGHKLVFLMSANYQKTFLTNNRKPVKEFMAMINSSLNFSLLNLDDVTNVIQLHQLIGKGFQWDG